MRRRKSKTSFHRRAGWVSPLEPRAWKCTRFRHVQSSGVAGRGVADRSGLAPLELVLMLPLLMMILALMINFGHQTAWKTRAHWAARQAEWRQRPTHYAGSRDAAPRSWPAPNTLTVELAPAPPIFAQDPYVAHQVVRGPTLRAPQSQSATSQLEVDQRMLDFDDDLKQGRARINRQTVLLPKMDQIQFDVRHPLLESEWRFHDMGYGSNFERRILKLYGYNPPAQVLDLVQQFSHAAELSMRQGDSPAMAVLDRDEELAAWYGSAPDFHPQLPRTVQCELNREVVNLNDVQPLIDRIQGPRGGGRGGVPERVAQSFLGMYQGQINQLQQMKPPPQGQIDALQEKVRQIRQFLRSLR